MTFTGEQFQAVENEYVDLLRRHADLSEAAAASDRGPDWDDSGVLAARSVYKQTIGVFVRNFGVDGARVRLNDPAVSRYVLSAIEAIGSKATELAEGGEVDGWHVRAAAKAVIKKFRKICPQQVSKGTFEKAHPNGPKWAHGDLCREFETREE